MKGLLLPAIFISCFTISCNETWVWMSIDPVQCGGNPWEQLWLADHDNDYTKLYSLTSEEELTLIKEYYQTRGIVIYRIKRTYPYDATCAACTCPRGDRIHCSVNDRDIDRMLEMGFVVE